MKHLLEAVLEGLRAGRYRRTEVRRGYRNGYRQRSLLARWGLVERLRVPRGRDGCYQPTVLPAYQRRQEEVNHMVREMFLARVSTRKASPLRASARRVQEVVAPLLGIHISPQTVSRILRSLDVAAQRYRPSPGRLLPVAIPRSLSI